MSLRNPLREEARSQEQIGGEGLTNLRNQRIVRLQMPDGTVQEVLVEAHISQPGPDGTYNDTEVTNVFYDEAGNPLNLQEPTQVILSHSGLYITSPDQRVVCTSALHPQNLSRNILVGQDGQLTAGGAICSRCASLKITLYLILGILGLGLAVGLYKGLGWF